MFQLEPLPAAIRLLTNPEMERLRAKYPSLPKTPTQCITCDGTGAFRWWNAERTEAADWKCNCTDQWVLHHYLLHANIPLVYQRLGWADVTHVAPEVLQQVREYRDEADSYVRIGYGLVLHGFKGNGKTMLATLLLKGLLAAGYTGYFTTFTEMLSIYTAAWHSDDERQWFDHHIRNVTFLVLDDPGKEYGGARGSGLAGAAFDAVLRYRVAAGMPTIVTTNLGPDDIPKLYGDTILDLLTERSVGVPFASESFRKLHKERSLEERAQGLVRPVVIS